MVVETIESFLQVVGFLSVVDREDEEVDEPCEGVLVHRLYVGQVRDREEQDRRVDGDRFVSHTGIVNFLGSLISNRLQERSFFYHSTRHVFVKHGCPRRQQSQNMAKISKSYILIPPHPQGQVMSVKCEEPIDELTVQVWLLYDHPNFKYCILFVSGTELRTDRRTDDPITRSPRRTYQAVGHKNRNDVLFVKYMINMLCYPYQRGL